MSSRRSFGRAPSIGSPRRHDSRRRAATGGVAALGVLIAAFSGVFLVAAGQSALSPADTRAVPAGFPGGPHFILSCGFSHRNNDDAIVFPGEPGRSHNHTYIGNFSVDASTTPSSLLGERTTCDFEADSSAYWAPTLYVGRRAVIPYAGIVYYVRRTLTDVAPLPAGLRMIAGSATARRPQSKSIVAWSCGELGSPPRFPMIQECARRQGVQLQVTFPNCWNGTSLDSPDHKRHMAYSSTGACPALHPTALPTIVVFLLYPPVPVGGQVASGRFGAHADFMNGWNQEILASLIAQLNEQARNGGP